MQISSRCADAGWCMYINWLRVCVCATYKLNRPCRAPIKKAVAARRDAHEISNQVIYTGSIRSVALIRWLATCQEVGYAWKRRRSPMTTARSHKAGVRLWEEMNCTCIRKLYWLRSPSVPAQMHSLFDELLYSLEYWWFIKSPRPIKKKPKF